MKSTLLATAAAVGLLALPNAAFASPPDRGFVEANVGFGWTDEDFQDTWSPFDDPFSYGAKTRWLFPLSQPVDVMQALSLAGGTTAYAAVNDIVILRRENGNQQTLRFHYADVERGRELAQNVLLRSGDTVVVP